MITNCEKMKKIFNDKGIPIIINEVGIITEDKKGMESIIEFLKVEFFISSSYEGIMPCLWDTSNNGVRNYYDKVNDKWNDEIIKNNFKKISKKILLILMNFYIILIKI